MSSNSLEKIIAEAEKEYGGKFSDALKKKSYGLSFTERLMMGFIFALDEDTLRKKSGKQRRSDALEALTGIRPPERADAADDWDELSTMAHWHASDLAAGLSRPRSARILARQVCNLRGVKDERRFERLRKKFSQNKEMLMGDIDEMRIEVELVHRRAMADIESILRIVGVKFYDYP